MIRRLTSVFAFILCVASASSAPAQEATPAGQADHVAAIKQSLQKSTAALHHYTWVETTTVSIKGEEKSRTQKSCFYGADGKVQKADIGEPHEESKAPHGLRGRIAKHKKAEISDSMHEAIALVKQYVPPDSARIQEAKDNGRLSLVPPDPQGNLKVVITDYLKDGDSLSLDANAATNRLTGMAVSSFTDSAKDTVGLQVTFDAFADGTVYAATTKLSVASQHVEVDIENSDYQKK